MPELPDVELYRHALEKHLVGQTIRNVVVRSPFVLRTFELDLQSCCGQTVERISRIGKRIVWHLPERRFLIFHLMISGRFHRRKAGSLPRTKVDLLAFHFDDFALMVTEAGKKKRASLHFVEGRDALLEFDRGGLDVLKASCAEFAKRLRLENRIVKRALTDPSVIDGIGNAYSDEVLHHARLSPFCRTQSMTDEQLKALYHSARTVLVMWRDRLIRQNGDRFPEKVTAFRPEMAVHGKFKAPCPACQTSVQRIVYAEKEWNYCPKCQTDGKLLADRSLSRLLKDDWPDQVP